MPSLIDDDGSYSTGRLLFALLVSLTPIQCWVIHFPPSVEVRGELSGVSNFDCKRCIDTVQEEGKHGLERSNAAGRNPKRTPEAEEWIDPLERLY